MQTANDDVIEIDLQELFGYLLHWLWLIAACGIVAGLAGFLISKFAVTPLYKSTTTVYILNKQDSGNNNLTYSDLQLGSQLTMDYALLITSRTVLEQVIGEFAMDATYEQLARQVDVQTVSNTRSINITVTNPDPLMAMMLADEIREIAAEHITSVMDIQAVNLVDSANLPNHPSSPSVMKWTMVGMLIGIFLCGAVLVVHYLLDDTVKSSEDIEKYLGLSTLAMIPIVEDSEKRKSKRHESETTSAARSRSVRGGVGEDDLEIISDERGVK